MAAGILLFSVGLRTTGALVLLAAVLGLRAAFAVAAPALPGIRDGSPVTLRGVVEHRPMGSLLETSARLTPDGWATLSARFGVPGDYPFRDGQILEVSGIVRRPPPPTQPGDRSLRLDWLRRGVYYVVEPRSAGIRVLGAATAPPWRQASETARRRLLGANRRTLTLTAATIANDFLIEDTESPDPGLTRAVRDAFRSSGTIHLLVVSGTQVALALLPFLLLGWHFYRARLLFWTAGAAALLSYYLITDGDPAVARAAVMGAALVLGLALNRKPDLENCLGGAALVLMVAQPLVMFDIGFHLSFAAAWSLSRLAPTIAAALGPTPEPPEAPRSWFYGVHRALAGAVAVSVAAHLAVAPILGYHFQQSTWSGILANLPAGATAMHFVYTAIAHAILSLLGITVLAPLVEWGAGSLYGAALFFSRPPFGAGPVYPPPLWLLPVCLVALAIPSWLPRGRAWTLGAVTALVALLVLSERTPAAAPATPTLQALDVGQGDALLLRAPDGASVLIDSGPPGAGRGGSGLIRALRALRIPRLDAVVVTHPHLDHIGALPEVLSQIPVGMLIHPPTADSSEAWLRALDGAYRRRIPVLVPEPGDRIAVGSTRLTVLGPIEAPESTPDETNEQSLVLRWEAGGARVLLTGDVEEDAERALLGWGPELRADVLKVAHHGSAGSTGDAWLRAVAPRCALISCGRGNRFGHPAPAVLERLRAADVPCLRTDRDGMITVSIDRDRIRIHGYATGQL